MATTITMPQLGETVTEGTVAQWLKQPGDSVEKYEAFVEVSTDKVNAEVPSPVTGVIRELIVKEGETVPTGAPIAIIDDVAAGTTPEPNGSASPAEQVAAAAAGGDRPPKRTVRPATTPSPAATSVWAVRRTPRRHPRRTVRPATARRAARRRAARASRPRCAGSRASTASTWPRVRGTGDHGRITANDILAAAKAGPSAGVAATISRRQRRYRAPAPAAAQRAARAGAREAAGFGTAKPAYGNAQPGDLIPLTQARKIIAQRMVDSKHTAPHAWTMTEVDVTNVWKWRAREKDAFEKAYGVKLTLLPFFIRAAVESLGAFPLMNASFTDEGIRVHREVNVGLAIAADGNLVVPVIRHADQLSIKGTRARRRRADRQSAARQARRRRSRRRHVHRQQHRRERLDPERADPGARADRDRHHGSGRETTGRARRRRDRDPLDDERLPVARPPRRRRCGRERLLERPEEAARSDGADGTL